MSRSMEIGRYARGIANRKYCARPFGGGDPGARRAMVDRYRIVGTQRRCVVFDHRLQAEPVADVGQNGHAKLAPAVGDHEVDRLGRHFLGGADKISLILAVLGIDHDYNIAAIDSVDSFFDSGKMEVFGNHILGISRLSPCRDNLPFTLTAADIISGSRRRDQPSGGFVL